MSCTGSSPTPRRSARRSRRRRREHPRSDAHRDRHVGPESERRCSPVSVAVGIDVGTSAVKAIAVAADGEVLERREVAYGLSTPRPGWSEQDPADWWRATKEALDGLG